MKISELMYGINVKRTKLNEDIEIYGITSDSRKCEKGYVFIALKGGKRNGNEYINDALSRGCVCIITDVENIYYEFENIILVSDSRIALSFMWSNYYKNPSKDLKIIGITGTNGKTSTAYFLYSILKKSKKRVGLISTVGCFIDDEEFDTNGGGEVVDIASAMTTPDPELLYAILSKMKNRGIEYVVMEASSHALELSKLSPIDFEAGIFTNLSEEHLDFHKTMENYFSSKAKLFYRCKYAVINIDDKYSTKLCKYVNREFITFGRSDGCDYKIEDIITSKDGSSYILSCNSRKISLKTRICGEFSVYNSSAAAVVSMFLGISDDNIQEGIFSLFSIDGRIEKISDGIYIDYAHTPAAMINIIESVKKIEKDKSITVLFGCGGDRDKHKRKIMGEIASDLCDSIIITSDNSRTEDPAAIINDIVGGIKEEKQCYIVPDRRNALELGVRVKGKGVLLVLGKGHEKYEIDKNGKHYFDEKLILIKAIEKYDKILHM